MSNDAVVGDCFAVRILHIEAAALVGQGSISDVNKDAVAGVADKV